MTTVAVSTTTLTWRKVLSFTAWVMARVMPSMGMLMRSVAT